MTIKEIFECFENTGFQTFSTIDGGFPASRIAHFFAYDKDGLYFRTMSTKPFYHQLMENKTVSVCGLFDDYDEEEDLDLPVEGNYSIRITGTVKTISPDALRNKAKKNDLFQPAVEEMEKYRTMRIFVLHKGFGEIFNYDFNSELDNGRLNRIYFSINDMEHPFRGLRIDPAKCQQCGACFNICSFDAIQKSAKGYKILNHKCDACGDCTVACKHDAIDIVVK